MPYPLEYQKRKKKPLLSEEFKTKLLLGLGVTAALTFYVFAWLGIFYLVGTRFWFITIPLGLALIVIPGMLMADL